MKDESFYKELDKLIEKGEKSVKHPDIDIEALHFGKTIRSRIDKWKNRFAFLLLLLLLLIGVVVSFFALPDFQKKLGLVASYEIEKNKVDAQNQLNQLTKENDALKENVDSLISQIEILQSSPATKTGSVENESQGESSSDGITRHLVERGETLYELAKKYYGDGMMYKIVQEDNKLKVPEDLAEGMTLKIYPEKRKL